MAGKKVDAAVDTVYSDGTQREILLAIQKLAAERFRVLPSVREVRLEGSLSTGDFGISAAGFPDDINLVVFADRIPREWRRAGVGRMWYSLYNFPDMPFFLYKGKEHALDLLVVARGKKQAAREAIRDSSGVIYLRKGEAGKYDHF
jgi:hypothetical protein